MNDPSARRAGLGRHPSPAPVSHRSPRYAIPGWFFRTFSAPGWPLTPLAFMAFSAWMAVYAVSQRPKESLAGLLTVVVGTAFYWIWRRNDATARRLKDQEVRPGTEG